MARRIECLYYKFLHHLKQRYSNTELLIKILKDISLKIRRDLRDQLLLYKLVNNMIDSLVSKLNFACHRLDARNKPLHFAVPKFNTKYTSNNFVSRACKYYNFKHNNLDIFNLKFNNFKGCLHKLLWIVFLFCTWLGVDILSSTLFVSGTSRKHEVGSLTIY